MSLKTMCGFILLFAILRITAGQTSLDKHMICKEVTSIFGQQVQPATSAAQGRPGKIGPKGPRGEIGPPGVAGEPGTIDYAQVWEIIRLEVQESFNRIDEKFGRAFEQINKVNELLSQTQSEVNEALVCLPGFSGIAYNGSCIWAEKAPAETTLEVALQTCNRRTPSKLPEVYGEQEYLKIMGYMRSKLDGGPHVHAWTRMTRDIMTGKALLSDGSVAPYTKTRPAPSLWSNADATRTHVYLLVRTDPHNLDQGMGAAWPSFNFGSRVILCQKL